MKHKIEKLHDAETIAVTSKINYHFIERPYTVRGRWFGKLELNKFPRIFIILFLPFSGDFFI